jgi:hypothetical protein
MLIRYYLITLSIIFSNLSYCQTHNKIGLKAGILISGISSNNSNGIILADSSSAFSFVSMDIGIFKEWFDSKRFCISTELHYLTKGEQNPEYNRIVTPVKTSQGEIYEYRYLPDRFKYLSLQIFPRYRIILTSSGENIYIFGGPTIDFLLENSSSVFPDEVVPLENSKLTFGGTIGAGSEILDFLSCEIKYDHSFTGPYNIKYGDITIHRRHNTLLLLVGVSFNKFF